MCLPNPWVLGDKQADKASGSRSPGAFSTGEERLPEGIMISAGSLFEGTAEAQSLL